MNWVPAFCTQAGQAVPGNHFQRPEVGCALGRHPPGDRLLQRAIDDVGHHVADRGPGVDGRGVGGADDGAGGCGDLHRIQRAGIVRDRRRDDAVDAEGRIGFRIAQRAIDRVGRHAGGAGVVDMDRVVADRHGRNQIDRRFVTVDPHAVRPGPLRQLADRFGHRAAAAGDDLLAQRLDLGQPEFAHHRNEAAAADIVAGDQRVDVAHHLDRFAHIGADHRQQVLVHFAGAHQAQQRNEQAFMPDLASFRRLPDTAHVDQMGGAGEQRDDPAVHEGGRDDHQVVQMPGALPGIVGDVDITFLHVLDGKHFEEMPDGGRHRVDVPRCAGHRLRQHPALQVEHARPRCLRPPAPRSKMPCAPASVPAPRRPRAGGST